MKEKVLITGGAGFIGSHTADALIAQGFDVRVLDILHEQIHPNGMKPSYLNPEVEFIKGDVCNAEDVAQALQGVSYVFHFAAETGVGQSMYEISRYFKNTVSGTAMLWEQIAKTNAPIKKVILSSSRAVYGEGRFKCPNCQTNVFPKQRLTEQLLQGKWMPQCTSSECVEKQNSIEPLSVVAVDEDSKLQPVSIYGYTKLHQENICGLMGDIREIPVIILRYFNVFGPRQALNNPYTGVIANFFLKIMNENPITLYEEGTPVRDFVFVKDVVQANLLALAESTTPGVYNVGIGSPITIRELAEAIILASGEQGEIVSTQKFRVGDIFGFYADIEKSQQLLGYIPKYSVIEGLKELIKSWSDEIPEDNSHQAEKELKELGLLLE